MACRGTWSMLVPNRTSLRRSGSMDCSDRRPLPNSPGTNLISRTCNNRLGAVYSALHAFWMSRNAATAAGARRDAYSILLFDHDVSTGVANNFTSNPDELLNIVLAYHARGGTNFVAAVTSAQALMQRHWHTERYHFMLPCFHLVAHTYEGPL